MSFTLYFKGDKMSSYIRDNPFKIHSSKSGGIKYIFFLFEKIAQILAQIDYSNTKYFSTS